LRGRDPARAADHSGGACSPQPRPQPPSARACAGPLLRFGA
jgi:hypothetical protein